ncbi:MAG: radical SAM protein [Bacteroidales bacterium]|nr:radical SAM protein [Bacteroidales bacterium]
MFFSPILYEEPVFRPPAEANSAIIQATIGCSWNKCAFCEMYTAKTFRTKKWSELQEDITNVAKYYKGVRKIFLADGNAMVLSTSRLVSILEEINLKFGRIQRISSYALPADIRSKTKEELIQLKNSGLKLLYIGIESGNDDLLQLINKSETHDSTVEGIIKAHEAGIDTSIMVINGLGGRKFSHQHAVDSALLINKVNPKFLSMLTLSLPFGQDHFMSRFGGEYIPQTIVELAEELKLFIQNLDIINTIFRTDHISNNLILKGAFPKDKDNFFHQIENAIINTEKDAYPGCSPIL